MRQCNGALKGGVTFYAVNSNSPDMFKEENPDYLSCKLNADVFIDDCNVGGLPDWPTIYKIISSKASYAQLLYKKFEEERDEEQEPPAPKWMFWKSNRR